MDRRQGEAQARVRNGKLAQLGTVAFALGLIGVAVFFMTRDPQTAHLSLAATGVLCAGGGVAYWFNRAG